MSEKQVTMPGAVVSTPETPVTTPGVAVPGPGAAELLPGAVTTPGLARSLEVPASNPDFAPTLQAAVVPAPSGPLTGSRMRRKIAYPETRVHALEGK